MNIVARTAGDRHCMRGSQTKSARYRIQKPFFNKRSFKAKESWYYPMCSFNFLLGVRRGRIGQGNALWNARPKMWMCLAACELPFYKGALCAFNLTLWQLQDGDGWWSSKFFWRAFGTEHACESPRHGSPQAGLFLSSVHVVLSFVLHFKELRN